MKLFQKALLAFAGVSLTAAAAYPYTKAYLDSLPKRLTTEQAGKVYLGAVCPINKYANYLDSLEKKYNHEASISYFVGSDALANANQRVAQLGLRHKLAIEGYAKAEVQASKVLSNPKIVWPDDVKKDVQDYSTYLFTHGGLGLNGQFKDAKKLVGSNGSSKIRHLLNLPTVNKGCESIK